MQVHRTQPHVRSVPGGQIREEILNRGFVTELVLEQTTTVVGDDELDVNGAATTRAASVRTA